MDTKTVAELIGVTAKTFRQFLRSPQSTFLAVGSGARYEFDMEDMPALTTRFKEWSQTKGRTSKVHPSGGTLVQGSANRPHTTRRSRISSQLDKDRQVWADEGPIVLEDIRDPRVRARVRRDAELAEARLEAKLLAAGLHITQQWG